MHWPLRKGRCNTSGILFLYFMFLCNWKTANSRNAVASSVLEEVITSGRVYVKKYVGFLFGSIFPSLLHSMTNRTTVP